MNISVCMIVRDEERSILRALSSIPSHYETIVLDTGSVDQTVELALAAGAIVKYYEWKDDFAEARNASIKEAAGEYILVMDADEELPADVDEQIGQFVQRHPLKAGTVTIRNIGDDGEVNKHRMVRFFPNRDSFHFSGLVHEKLFEDREPAAFEDTGIEILHYGYSAKEYETKGKFNRYLELYRKQLELHPNDGYMLYQLGKLYYSTGVMDQAIEALFRCLNEQEEQKLYFPAMLILLGYALKNTGQSASAEQLLAPYADLYKDFPDLPFLLGLLAMDTGKIGNIEPYFKRALAIGETQTYSSIEGVGSYKAAYNLGVFYEVLGQSANAMTYYQESARHDYKPAVERLKKIQ